MDTEELMQPKIFWIDNLRGIACLMVVMIHTTTWYITNAQSVSPLNWDLANVLNSASRVSVPLFFMIRSVGLYDNLISVIVASAAFSIPMCTIVLTASMRQITNELYEAMSVDGASVVRIFFQLTLPMSKSGLATVIIYSAMGAWNNFMFPLILTQSDSNRVLTLNLYQYQSQFGIDIPGMMAAVILSVLPILVVYFIGRRSLVDGMMGMGGK